MLCYWDFVSTGIKSIALKYYYSFNSLPFLSSQQSSITQLQWNKTAINDCKEKPKCMQRRQKQHQHHINNNKEMQNHYIKLLQGDANWLQRGSNVCSRMRCKTDTNSTDYKMVFCDSVWFLLLSNKAFYISMTRSPLFHNPSMCKYKIKWCLTDQKKLRNRSKPKQSVLQVRIILNCEDMKQCWS